ncbi:hypothetical protein [Halovibrio sp. HP20-50]|uniref:hypothetical protein n=1 Tax=Halovibrio sp. HP20-59 TaxID=3080275 RepID=UPI00294B23C4|nr:hypothetical protein [Halovibrio sp. HP20-59]MEA2118025.1 hypothetical protein [Halovibrio sp. HP20-59]
MLYKVVKTSICIILMSTSGLANAEFTHREAQLVRDLIDYCNYHKSLVPSAIKLKGKGYTQEAVISGAPDDQVWRMVVRSAYELDATQGSEKLLADNVENRCFDQGLTRLTRGEIK